MKGPWAAGECWGEDMYRAGNTPKHEQIIQHIADNISNAFLWKEKFRILIKILLKFGPWGSFDNKSAWF